MSIAALPKLLQTDSAFAVASSYTHTSCDFSAPLGLRVPLIAAIYRERQIAGLNGALLVIAATSREAENLRQAFAALLPEADSTELPAWETLPHERLSPARETTGKRLLALAALRKSANKPFILVASVRAVLQTISPFTAEATPLTLQVGTNTGAISELAVGLIELGYERVDMVTKRGQFAVRGGILDIFPVTAASAVRVDFFGDEIESLKEFAVSDQRSQNDIAELAIWPARELLLTPEVTAKAEKLLRATSGMRQEMLHKIAAGVSCEGMESLIPQLVEKQYAITELLPANSMVTVFSPEKVASRAVSLAATNAEFLAASWGIADGHNTIDYAQLQSMTGGLYTLHEVRHAGDPQLTWHTVGAFGSDETCETVTPKSYAGDSNPADSFETAKALTIAADETVTVAAAAIRTQTGQDTTTQIIALLQQKLRAQYRAFVALSSSGALERAAEILAAAEIAFVKDPDFTSDAKPGTVTLVQADALAGFELEAAKILFVTEAEFFGRAVSAYSATVGKPRRRQSKNVVDPLALKAGDYVVHEVHGIGKFVELTAMQVPGSARGEQIKREYLVLEYAASKRGMPADILYVPTDQLGQLSRYIGAEAPTLSKMGGSDWANAKKKARKAVREIAIGLAKLYAVRSQATGFAFSPDTPWQHELEQSFKYIETADQLQAIADVKHDMELPRPMDRLILGDVGFGKTEIAVRAAFKAVQDNKQVAVLVPTTLLVKQHFETFSSRFAGFPVRLKALSRFQSDKEAQEIIAGLKTGEVDVVIGTHRLLAKGIEYKDLGLIIIDEEQRFGVEHKELLKDLKHNVDVLSMSATPIPRTLEMAVTGIREMSQLQTAPEDRHPILTFVGQRSDAQVAAAIRREMLREGQIFYVHNRVSSIHRVAQKIAESVPEARVAVAHGKLSQSELEQVVVDFWERKYDVLVSTTIIETGLDIANANTIIIDGADKYGLSQLHQLRGRVGRGRERAYAYFLYDPEKMLTEQAHERLETIATHNELGSGMQVALKDLELRGAGNLLGGEQSGHIAGVGFDLYLRMVGEAIDTFKGQAVHETKELTIELPVDARIPESYLDSERLRLEAYQKLSAAAHPNAPSEHLDLVAAELLDRYGAFPAQVQQLIELSRLRRVAALCEVQRIFIANGQLRIEPLELLDSRQMRLRRLYPGAEYTQLRQRSAVNETAQQTVKYAVSVPLPSALAGSAGKAGSPFDRGAKAADKAADGDLVAWVLRVFKALVGDE